MGQKITIKYKGKVLETVDINAKSLYIRGEGIESIRDIEGLDQLVRLEFLVLDRNKIARVEGLDPIVKLKALSLSKNKITKIEGLDRLVNLEYLDLSENQIGRIEGLDQLVNLNEIKLDGNQIAKIEGLDRLVKLKRLDLVGNQLARIEGLDRLVNLNEINLDGNQIAKIEGLDRLVKLKRMDLVGNQIARIEGLDRLKGTLRNSREYHSPSTAETFLGIFLVPELVANGIFIGLGFLFMWLVPPSYIIMYWCALLIAGTGGMAGSCLMVTYTTDGDDNDYFGTFLGVIRVNGFVYAGEIVWFLIVSLQLAGSVGLIILAQFIGQYIGAYLISSGASFFDLPSKGYGKK